MRDTKMAVLDIARLRQNAVMTPPANAAPEYESARKAKKTFQNFNGVQA
jgi:hypothetical protein